MFKNNTSKFYTSKIDSEKLELYTNNDVIRLLTKEYPEFQMGYIPEHYDIAFILIKEDMDDSFNDEWKMVFFKKTLDIADGGTITLDNIEDLKKSDAKYEIYKTLDGSFENVINISCDLITKHKANIQEIGVNNGEGQASKAANSF